MLNFLRRLFGLVGERSPAEPVHFEQTIRIAARPGDLFPLVDWGNQEHLWRQRGHRVTQQEDGAYLLRISSLPGTRFEIRVVRDDRPNSYVYESVTTPMIGKLIGSHEEYRFEQLEGDLCRVTLAVDARFVPGLRPRVWRFEQEKMHISLHNALAKLKLMAEEGIEAVETASKRLIV